VEESLTQDKTNVKF